jgi:hypothetical protein
MTTGHMKANRLFSGYPTTSWKDTSRTGTNGLHAHALLSEHRCHGPHERHHGPTDSSSPKLWEQTHLQSQRSSDPTAPLVTFKSLRKHSCSAAGHTYTVGDAPTVTPEIPPVRDFSLAAQGVSSACLQDVTLVKEATTSADILYTDICIHDML